MSKTLPLWDVINQKIQEVDSNLGVNERQLFAIKSLVQNEYQIGDMDFEILPGEKIVIHPKDADGKRFIFKPKNGEILSQLQRFLDLRVGIEFGN